jgi:hypothetical protein
MTAPLQSTQSAAGSIVKVRYTHDAMIDLIIANPAVSQKEIARHFGYTEAWVSRVHCSDAFQARLAERRTEVVDPILAASVKDKMEGVISQSLDILAEKLEATRNPDLAIKALDIASKAAGYGARQQNVAVQNQFVVHIPNKIQDPHAWADAHRPGGMPVTVIEAETR